MLSDRDLCWVCNGKDERPAKPPRNINARLLGRIVLAGEIGLFIQRKMEGG